MRRFTIRGVKPACSNSFELFINALRHLGREALRKTFQPFNLSTVQLVKAKAFTLAETLIVIGIIGVVAALTLPNLNHATGDKERITRVKKIYSSLNDAFERAQVVYGDASGWYNYAMSKVDEADQYVSDHLFTDRISEFMKVSKVRLNDIEKIVTLPDGMEFIVYSETPNSSIYHEGETFLGTIYVDIDGFNKGKQQDGYDNFIFEMTDYGIYPEGIDEENVNIFDKNYSWGHSKWILENDNMDYLKADEEGVCPDGTQLSWTVTSCN